MTVQLNSSRCSPLDLPRRPEPAVPDRRLGVGDAPEEVDLGAVAADLAHAAHLFGERRGGLSDMFGLYYTSSSLGILDLSPCHGLLEPKP